MHTRITRSGQTFTYGYDPLGRLHSVTGPTTRTMLHDGVNVIAEYASGGALRYRWVHAPGLDEPLVQYHAGEVPGRYWLIADERGSVVTRTNGSGIRTQVNVYDEYANTVSTHTSGSPGRFGYAGALWFDETGLYHMRNRAYNPRMMRFMQADPIGHSGGMNLYAYVGGDPVNYGDPWGLRRACAGSIKYGTMTCRIITISEEENRSLRDFFNDMRAQSGINAGLEGVTGEDANSEPCNEIYMGFGNAYSYASWYSGNSAGIFATISAGTRFAALRSRNPLTAARLAGVSGATGLASIATASASLGSDFNAEFFYAMATGEPPSANEY